MFNPWLIQDGIISQATSDLIMAGASSNYICSMVRGRLQRNYHVCIRGMTYHKHIGRANRDTGILAVPICTGAVL